MRDIRSTVIRTVKTVHSQLDFGVILSLSLSLHDGTVHSVTVLTFGDNISKLKSLKHIYAQPWNGVKYYRTTSVTAWQTVHSPCCHRTESDSEVWKILLTVWPHSDMVMTNRHRISLNRKTFLIECILVRKTFLIDILNRKTFLIERPLKDRILIEGILNKKDILDI